MNAELRQRALRVRGRDGCELVGEELGSGSPLLLLHGLTATRRYVLQGSTLLARRGCRLVSYDARGHGESEPAAERTAYEYSDLVADLGAVLDALDLERCVLIGSSMGAATAMAFALAQPQRVEALVQITPAYAGTPPDRPRELELWDARADAIGRGDLDAFVELTGVADLPAGFRDAARTATRQRAARHRHVEAVADALRIVPRSRAFDSLDQLGQVELPVLLVGSRDESDPGHPLAVAQEYSRQLPNSELMVEESGKPPIAWQGAQLSRAIATFLETNAATGFAPAPHS